MDFVCGSKCVCMKLGGGHIPWFIIMCWFKLQFWGIPLFSDTRIADWWCQIVMICVPPSLQDLLARFYHWSWRPLFPKRLDWFSNPDFAVESQLWMTWVCSKMWYAPKSHSLGQMKWWVLDFVVAYKFSMDKYLVTPSVLITTHEPNTQDPRDKTCNFPRRRHLDPPGCWFPKWKAPQGVTTTLTPLKFNMNPKKMVFGRWFSHDR